MTQEEIKDFIAKLKADTDDAQGYFGIFQYGGGSEESYIKANKQGLQLFVAALLDAVTETDHALTDAGRKTIPFAPDSAWIDENSDTVIHYVEPAVDVARTDTSTGESETFKDVAIKYGCIAVMLLLVFALLTGIVTIVKWVF